MRRLSARCRASRGAARGRRDRAGRAAHHRATAATCATWRASAVNPLVMDPARGRAGLGGVRADRGAAARPPVAAALRAGQRRSSSRSCSRTRAQPLRAAAGAARTRARPSAAEAIRGLGGAQEQSIRATAPQTSRRCGCATWWCARGARRGSAASDPAARGRGADRREAHERSVRESLRHTEGDLRRPRGDGPAGTALDGAEVLDLLHERFDPDALEAGALAASFLHPEARQAPRAPASQRERRRARAGARAGDLHARR